MTTEATLRVRSLAELLRGIEPPRDLWPAIAAQITGEQRQPAAQPRWLWALAAGLAALTIGVLLGRVSMTPQAEMSASSADISRGALFDAKFLAQRNQLRSSVQQQVAVLPLAERDKVLRSVTALRRAVEDIQSALGKDPGNALLQELLVNACQDEMTNLSDIRNSETKL
jgi:hypothetical protein